jgi:hypothetical protein
MEQGQPEKDTLHVWRLRLDKNTSAAVSYAFDT